MGFKALGLEACPVANAEEARETLRRLTGRVELHLANRAGEQLRTGAILFSKAFGLLGETGQAPALLQHIREG